MSGSRSSRLISAARLFEELSQNGGGAKWRVVDATWYLPGSPWQAPEGVASARSHHTQERIPGACFVDIDEIGDASFGPTAHNLPTADTFGELMSDMAITHDTNVVVYDSHGMFSAPRFWYTMCAFGHKRTFVLNGGLPEWKRSGYDVATSALPVREKPDRAEVHRWTKNDAMQVGLDGMRAMCEDDSVTIVDARGAARFAGEAPEPRPGMRSGHIPNSKNVFFGLLLDEHGCMKSKNELSKAFENADVPLDSSSDLVLTCGSGLSACILGLGLSELGICDIPVYDGSWSEWGSRSDTPVATSRSQK